MSAAGFAMGDVVLAELLKDRDLLCPYVSDVSVYLMIEEEEARADAQEGGCAYTCSANLKDLKQIVHP